MEPLPSASRQSPPPPRPPAPPTTAFGDGRGDGDDHRRDRRAAAARRPVRTPRASLVGFVAASAHELGHVTWPRRTVIQHSAVVLTVLVLLVSLVLLVDVGGAALLRWLTG